MIIKLLPEQVSAMWEAIKFAATEANQIRIDSSQEFLNNLLEKLLAEQAQAWMMYEDKEDGERIFYGVVITCFMADPIFKMNYLLVHSVYGYKALPLEIITSSMDAFMEFGKANECFKVVGMTNNDRLTKAYEFLGMKRELLVYSKDI